MAKQTARTEDADAAGEVSEDQEVKEPVTAFPSFAVEFDKVTERYTAAVREHYAKAHGENLTYEDPSLHIWDKYKNPESPDFRAGLSEDERAWAYDHEHDMLRGGKHFQLGNPFVFENPPTLSSAAMEANQAFREGMDEAIQYIFKQEGIEIPEGASFRLTVDPDYTIHVSGLEDEKLAESIAQALNSGDNGENLHQHLKITSPDGESLGVNYSNGHLEALDAQQELGKEALAEVRKQVGSICFHYSSAYNPHQGPLGVMALPGTPERTPAERESSYAAGCAGNACQGARRGILSVVAAAECTISGHRSGRYRCEKPLLRFLPPAHNEHPKDHRGLLRRRPPGKQLLSL